ncbi:MAG: double-strand break repair helicase AddA [Alphaproteobacteria bacterium]
MTARPAKIRSGNRVDPQAAQRPAANPEASVWVAASAGTGKTKVLVDRVLSLMLHGTRPERLLCLTFTKAAAAEMANRIHERLGRWATFGEDALAKDLAGLTGKSPDAGARGRARGLFAEVLDVPGGMKIQTIHAFCQSLLRRFPVEAAIAPHFQVMDERTAAEMLQGAREEVLVRARRADEDDGPDAALAAALAEATGHVHADAFAELMAELAGERGRLKRLIARFDGIDGLIAAVRELLGVTEGEDDASIVAAACEDTALDGRSLRAAAAALTQGSTTDRERGAALGRWLAEPESRAGDFGDYVEIYLTKEGNPRQALITRQAAAAAPGAEEALRAEAEGLIQVAEKRKAVAVAAATAAALTLGAGLLEAYRNHKAARGLLDYDDLILMTRDLLRRPGTAPWVLFKLDGGLDHILVDEAQDTNPEQWEVIAALAEEFFAGLGARDAVRTVFAVGDAKQSIYSFQRADPAAFERMRAHFSERVKAAGEKWRNLDLDISFRSTAAVLGAVDAIFSRDEARDGVGPHAHAIEHRTHRLGQAGLVELWPAAEPGPPPAAEPWQPPVTPEPGDSPRARLAALIARTIGKWIEQREMLESKGRPVRPGDIMVLVRRRSGFVEELVRALKQLEVPVAGVDRMVLTDQLPVMDLVALGRFLLLPEDDLTLATVLRGPLIGLDDEQLFELAHGRGEASLWQALKRKAGAARAKDSSYRKAHGYLAELLARVDYLRPFELYAEVLNARGGREKLLRRLGPEADDPLDEFLALALAFERVNAPSLQGFLHWVEAGRAEIKRDLEQSERDEVRIMTVHGAKGLQAPIVFLPDTVAAPVMGPRLLWVERRDGELPLPLWPPRRAHEEEVCAAARVNANRLRDQEYRRLFYVALTRAEDRLYICGWRTRNTPPDGCWYNLARAGLEDIAAKVAFDFSGLLANGWKGPGLRVVHAQGAEAEAAEGVSPRAGRRALPRWARCPAPADPTPPRPLAPSRPEALAPGGEPALRSPIGPDEGERFLRGRLIHRLLQSLPDLAPGARDEACRRYLARPVFALSAEDQAEIAAETLKVLEDPGFAPLFGPDSRAEVPVTGAVNGHVLSGQIDRLVVGDAEVVIVDYKTNRPPPRTQAEVPEIYMRQMAAYRAAIEQIYPDRSVTCALLWTDGPKLMALQPEVLDGYAP